MNTATTYRVTCDLCDDYVEFWSNDAIRTSRRLSDHWEAVHRHNGDTTFTRRWLTHADNQSEQMPTPGRITFLPPSPIEEYLREIRDLLAGGTRKAGKR